eukprot:CAMPEP_0114585962 /NCGR_PEP_ID=MMETSP0125-20121206/9338_1 /TAXON_ID=485358 ORGANISM="Aristerostoma sp., Strain ATCC 50986" /NCGR_SAMPLE_ID=MMETSP0125 /ASSEMBLY_ACC=CAM_ASM_000245 /LENGTH=113 /DNA_ID=CAMNT_0001781229 /DNA_START=63 /DNA_END=400 /DNA_ORIENTATION=+
MSSDYVPPNSTGGAGGGSGELNQIDEALQSNWKFIVYKWLIILSGIGAIYNAVMALIAAGAFEGSVIIYTLCWVALQAFWGFICYVGFNAFQKRSTAEQQKFMRLIILYVVGL